jgi:hypothetical protein
MANNKCGKENCNKPNCKNGSCKNGSCKKTTVIDATTVVTSTLSAKAPGINITTAKNARQPNPIPTPPETISNPSEAIRDTATTFHKLYEQYTALRVLAKPLNGLPQADPFPENVKIQNVNIAFSVDGEAHTAEISSPRIIGELAGLIGNELRSLIERMYQELFALEHVTASMQKAVQQAISTTSKTDSGITLKPAAESAVAKATEQSNEKETQSD